MTNVEIYDEAVAFLGSRNDVAVAEMLKREAHRNASVLQQQIEAPEGKAAPIDDQVGTFLAAHDDSNDRLLALSFAAIEYGSDGLLGMLKRAVGSIVALTTDMRAASALRPLASVVVSGRLLWAMATYALFVERIDAIARLDSIIIRPLDEDKKGVPVFGRRELRYPRALHGDAGNSYEYYSTWLQGRTWINDRLPAFGESLPATFPEADLLLALRMISIVDRATYSRGAEPPRVRRLADRFRDPAQRPALAVMFAVQESELDRAVEAAYEQIEYDRDADWDGIPPKFFAD